MNRYLLVLLVASLGSVTGCAALLGLDYLPSRDGDGEDGSVTDGPASTLDDGADACEVDSANDASNCGSCGNQCPAGNFCSEGACLDRCPANRAACGTACVDTSKDPKHCGGCNSACAASQTCEGGECKGACSEAPCKLVPPQCGCATGQGCYADDALKRTCLAAGALGEGSPCTQGNDTSCEAGLACREHKIAGAAAILCSRLCLVDADCKGIGSVCYAPSYRGAKACSVACDPVAQTGCAPTSKCVIVQNAGGNWTDCTVKGTSTGTQGAACTANTSSCAPGFACAGEIVNGVTTYSCAKYCRNSADCGGGRVCDGMAPLKGGAAAFGQCFLP